ncbi:MAG: transcriptional regulator [Pseudonocardiales bacterium]|nr:transcriptional regulator [Pseudonocardiales bacterium]
MRGLIALSALAVLVGGLPWALVDYVGWPLPHHVPTWPELQDVLLTPMGTQMLLNILTCICWVAWFAFVIDVARCTVDAARGLTLPRPRVARPVQGLAATLVGAVLLLVLGQRTGPPPASTTALTLAGQSALVVTAPQHPAPAPAATVVDSRVGITLTSLSAPPGMVTVTVTVQGPHDGIYDSLWRIAQRLWGDGHRWPELFAQNCGVIQRDGHALTTPGYLRPGWQLTASVAALTAAEHNGQFPHSMTPATSFATTVPSPSAPSTSVPVPFASAPAPSTSVSVPAPSVPVPAPATSVPRPATAPVLASAQPLPVTARPGGSHVRPATGITLPTGAFVSLSLAAAISTALGSINGWRRRRYRIGSGDRSDLAQPIAPVVRALRIAHQQATESPPTPPSPPLTPEPGSGPVTAVGVRDGLDVALNLAATHGLGLLGPGATAAARALLLSLLTSTERQTGVRVLIPAADVPTLFDSHQPDQIPTTMMIVSDLNTALDELESALLTRTRQVLDGYFNDPLPEGRTTLVLLASPAQHADRRLQAILDNGASLGIIGILLGQWRPGATARIRVDGTVSAASPGVGETLTGTRLFTLPATDTTALLSVLRDAQGPDQPDHDPREDHTAPAPPVIVRDNGQPPQPTTPQSGDASREQDPVDELTQLESTHPADACDEPPATESERREILESSSTTDPQDAVHAGTDDGAGPTHRQPPLLLTVLGRVALIHTAGDTPRDLTAALTPKQREVLVYLAINRNGARREALAEAIWPDSPRARPYNSLYSTLSLLRRNLSKATDDQLSEITRNDDGRYHLDPALVTVDYWHFHDALRTRRRATTDAERLDALHQASELYRGGLAEDLSTEWIEAPREATRRDALDALGVLIRALGDRDPERRLELLERARVLDPYNESVYRDIIRTQALLGQHESIPRTLTLLTTTLAELDQHPSDETTNLAKLLQHRNHQPTRTGSTAAS